MRLLKKMKAKKDKEFEASQLFHELYHAKNESEVDAVIARHPEIFKSANWSPLGGNESNFGVVENQQSSPVAALVEKITNSIDATLMRKCYEAGIDPKSAEAPRSIEDAIEKFFPNHKNWDLNSDRRKQAECLQILADGYHGRNSETSLIIYDDGEGQHPEEFENTFLSLLRGNKNEIHFVQGKYNMGGSGAIVFCGKKRYQLIASKRYDGTGPFGFTLVRKHPLTETEAQSKKNTWYEYLKIDGQIPAFSIDELPLGLDRRTFQTGTIIKLYSYDVKGNKHIRRDLSRSLNEFLYEPALPILMVESAKRYPNDKVLDGVVYGLKRRLQSKKEYIEETFSEIYSDQRIGNMKVTVHVFNARVKDKKPSETKKTIKNEFFFNRMAVLFSMNGQVHGYYTTEFISRSLKFNLLRDYLLIHVDCTEMNYNFRSELFMASRDRLKQGEESKHLRRVLANNLKKGQLKEIYKRRKDKISVEGAEDDSLLKSFAENLPISGDLRHLLSKTFKLDEVEKPKKAKPKSNSSNKSAKKGKKDKKEKEPFNPQRFPSFFKLNVKEKKGRKVVGIPLNGNKTIPFNSDVENQYFDRVDDPGELKMALLDYKANETTGGNKKGTPKEVSEIFNISRRSPQDGTIKVVFEPNEHLQVGDEVQVQVDLTSAGEEFSETFWVKITDPLSKPKPKPEPEEEEEEEAIGLPKHVLVYQHDSDHPNDNRLMTWDKLAESSIEMNWDTVMHPVLEGDVLETIYINMDSRVLKEYKSNIKNFSPEQNQLADRRYISAVYFHTLFLYVINKKRDYRIYKGDEEGEVDLADYLKELFASHYAAFLMNFGTSELMEALA
ncbi:MAG: hypothetical protein ACPGWR_03050 [Ardenticatenaceae bacterium]